MIASLLWDRILLADEALAGAGAEIVFVWTAAPKCALVRALAERAHVNPDATLVIRPGRAPIVIEAVEFAAPRGSRVRAQASRPATPADRGLRVYGRADVDLDLPQSEIDRALGIAPSVCPRCGEDPIADGAQLCAGCASAPNPSEV